MKTKTTAVKKKAAKKAAPATKKSAAKVAKKPLVYADNSSSFWVRNGQILNSLVALRDALSAMEKEVYLYHASKDKNDFANWVEVVLCDDTCAADLRKAKTPISAKSAVVKHLKLYSL
ncbi:MAG: hypothetical protein AAB388_01075 [Patescibacteria group bacterium]